MIHFVTFIIPTIGRQTLMRTLSSLCEQTDPDWAAIVIGDNVSTQLISSDWWGAEKQRNIYTLNLPSKLGHDNVAACVRNVGLSFAVSEWIASLDDDDTVTPDYVERLKAECNDLDLIHFRAEMENGVDLRPPLGNFGFSAGNVCNAFCFRREFARDHKLAFIDGTSEDWLTVKAFIGAGARAKMSESITYRIRH